MNVFIPWWGPLLAITVLVLGVANWWPDDPYGHGVGHAVDALVRLFLAVSGLSVMWIAALVWRLNS